QSSNEEKLDQIRGVVDEKLDKTLNERLDTNFKMVGDQLGLLYKSLGELQALSSGVSDLNRTLANVKTRGVWGEVQLGRILEQTMTKSQYAVNVVTKPNSDDRVEYAVLFPAQDGSGEQVYLPIDAKFPSDIYNRIIEAGESGDAKVMAAVTQELKVRILDEARTIRDKYLSPPHTTNYGIMFLPTEGLYAEVLRIDGLTEKCQQIGVIVAGPTTITAILNSLQAGFRNVALSKKSFEVMKLLEAVKTQFAKLDDEVERTQKKLSDATKSTDRLRHRTELIQRRMRNVTELDAAEARKLLDLEVEDEDTSTFDS
ncbi:MAG: DNA recombination protein RmuC, partial [Lachnospiraceae bacterium]|nr:DNA recombination protein RmuC [Lachnospiraceae bacterium]